MTAPTPDPMQHPTPGLVAVVGRGRMGRALVAALPGAAGPFGRGFDGIVTDTSDHTRDDTSGDTRDGDGDGDGDGDRDRDGRRRMADVVLLAVPDSQIAAAAACVRPGHLVGHTAGAIGLDVLAPHECFGVHPLMTVPATGADFRGAGAAVAGSTPRALAVARSIADRLGMSSFEIADDDRAAYHASASIASNFLVTLEDAAEALLATTGGDRRILVPLVRASLDNWAVHGGPAALTGPIARGDEATVARQRAAVAARRPELLSLFDVMCERTRALADRRAVSDGRAPGTDETGPDETSPGDRS